MNKTQFNDLLAYLKTRPSEAARMVEALNLQPQPQTAPAEEWKTAREIGQEIGQSAKWIKERLHLLPPGTYEQRGNRHTWWINATRNINQLQQMRA